MSNTIKALCIDDKGSRLDGIEEGKIYEIRIRKYGPDDDNICYDIVDKDYKGLQGWRPKRFVVLSDSVLPSGQRYCKCGTITANDVCCECKARQ